MKTFLDAVPFIIAGLLLTATAYFLMVGGAAILMSARYLRCPLCHHHYLGSGKAAEHECPHGWFTRGRAYLASHVLHRPVATR
ncbi:MAG TPA: hypothetical protein VGJ28_17505 [Micromonosporaceae bacterium]|jgi:hypothetical protein